MKETRDTAGAAEVAWAGVDGAVSSRGGMLLLASHNKWVFVVVTAPATTFLGLENHPAEWVNLKVLVN